MQQSDGLKKYTKTFLSIFFLSAFVGMTADPSMKEPSPHREEIPLAALLDTPSTEFLCANEVTSALPTQVGYINPINMIFKKNAQQEEQELPPRDDCCSQLEDLSSTLTVRNMELDGVGYPCGYSTVNAVGVLGDGTPGYYFVDARFHVLNNGRFAVNAGNGFRYQFQEQSGFVGINAFYDYRHRSANYHQVGAGLDFRKGRFFMCTNGYVPVVNPKTQSSEKEILYPNDLLVTKKAFSKALNRWDFEEGYFFAVNDTAILYAGGGPYYLWNNALCHSSTWGGMGHVKLNLKKYLTFEFFVSYDHFYSTKFQGQFAFTFPTSSDQNGVFPVFRQEIIPLKRANEWAW